MQQTFSLPSGHQTIPLQSLHYSHRIRPLARVSDRASSVMIDLQRDPVLTVTEEMEVEPVLDAMFRLGMRVLLVVRERAVVGVLSVQDVRRASAAVSPPPRPCSGATVRVADAMVPCAVAPSVDWQMMQQWSIADLLDIFAGCDAHYLMVLEEGSPSEARVRGLIARDRIERNVLTPPR